MVTAVNDLRDAARAYLQRGWSVLPLAAGTKLPRRGSHGCHDATDDARHVDVWWTEEPRCNVGIATGASSGFDVLDIDPQHGGDATLRRLELAHGLLPETVEQLTPHGGRHLLFQHVPGLKNRAGLPGCPGLDVRTTGGYIVGAPSTLADRSRAYAWEIAHEPGALLIAVWPDWLLHLVPRQDVRAASTSRAEPTEHPRAVSRARAYLAKLPGAISGQKGHNVTYRAACVLVLGFNLSAATALRVLLADFNPRCQPPWTEAELMHKVTDASKEDGERGYLLKSGTHALRGDDAEGAAGEPPDVECGADLHRTTQEAETALAGVDGPSVFVRGRSLVVVAHEGARTIKGVLRDPGSPFIHKLEPPAIREHLSRGARWLRRSKDGEWIQCLPPGPVVAALAARGAWPLLPTLAGIVETPTLRADCSILSKPGYDEETALVYNPTGIEYPAVPSVPTARDVALAVALLWEPFDQFEWEAAGIDRAVVLALILTFAGRAAFSGTSPCFVFDSTTRGSGKGLACAAAVMSANGRRPAISLLSPEPEEQRKALFTLAMEGHRAILFDNLTRPLGGNVLSACLTAGEVRDRVLGATKSATAPFDAVLLATGNNVRFMGDFDRRVLVARQAPTVELPEQRLLAGGYRHPNLLKYVGEQHPRSLTAAQTILRGFHLAGRPGHGLAPLGSFEPWDGLVRGACVWAGIGDPLASRTRIEGADEDREQLGALLSAWESALGTATVTVAEAVARSDAASALRLALIAFDGRGSAAQPNVASIANRLKGVLGRIVGGKRLERVGKTSPATYRVGLVGLVGLPTAGTNTRARNKEEGDETHETPEPHTREPGMEG